MAPFVGPRRALLFSPDVNQPPVATITGPADSSSHTELDTVNFTGTGTDTEDGSLTGSSLVWTSDLDGQFGTGTSVNTDALSVGTHTITLTATDSGGLTGTDQITVTITVVLIAAADVAFWKTADYDFDTPGSGIPQNGALGAGAAQLGSTSGADTNDPKALDHDGVDYGYLPGTVDNYFSTPAPASSPSTELEIEVTLEEDFGTPSGEVTLYNQWHTTGSQRGFLLAVDSSKKPLLRLSEDGTFNAALIATSSAALGALSAGDRVKVTWRASDERTQFFLNDVQLGADQAIAASGIHASTAKVIVGGTNDGGANNFEFKIRSGYHSATIGGAAIANPDFTSDPTSAYGTFADAAGNTWTVNRSSTGYTAAVIQRPAMMLDGVDNYLEVADHADLDFAAGEDFTLVAEVEPVDLTSVVLMGKRLSVGNGYILQINSSSQASLLIDTGTAFDDSTTGTITRARTTVAGYRSGSDAEALLDGVGDGVSAADSGSVANSEVLYFGRFDGGAYFQGLAYGFAIKRGLWTAAETDTVGDELLVAT